MANKITPADLLNLFLKQQKEIKGINDKLLLRLINNYGALYRKLQPYINNVILTIQANPKITTAQIKKLSAYIELLDVAESEIDDFSKYVKIELNTAGLMAAELAIIHLKDFYSYSGIAAKIAAPTGIDVLSDLLKSGGELSKRIELWAPNASAQIGKSIIEGVSLGRNPKAIAVDIRKAFGAGLNDAMRTTRTAQLWAYRESTRLNYLANSDIVKSWIWFASLDDPRTCLSCIAMHGTVHPLDEPMSDHHNGRCTMIPQLEGIDYGLQNAEEWFNALSEAQKTERMGIGRYKAYKDGLFTFDKLSRIYNDPVYGDMRSETPLKDLING